MKAIKTTIKVTEEFDIDEVIASLNKVLSYTERVNEYIAIRNGITVINGLLNELKQSEQEIKVDSGFFTDEAKKQLEMSFGCFGTYDFENEACQYCCLEDECKRRTKDSLEDETYSPCFGEFEEEDIDCINCNKRNACRLKMEWLKKHE